MNRYGAGLAVMMIVSGLATAQTEPARNYEWKQCNEDILGLRVDPAPLRGMLGKEFSPVLDGGRAQVAIMVQDCSQYWIDGQDLGPNQMVHVLVRIEGPGTIESVVGAETTEPTFTWLSLFAGSNNPRDPAARRASRTSPAAIEAVTLDPPTWPRGGSAVLGGDLRIAWRVAAAEESTLLMGVNHDVYVRDDSGTIVLKTIQAIGKLIAAPAPGVLEVSGDSGLGALLGEGTHPARVYSLFPIWARGTLGAEISE